jgi:hypothetical protein
MSEVELSEYIISKLGAHTGAKIVMNPQVKDIAIDMIVDDCESLTRYILEIKPKASVESIARLNLYKDIMARSVPADNVKFVLVTKFISPRMKELTDILGIETMTVPGMIKFPKETTKPAQGAVKITSEKAWKVVSGLIALRSSSIRNLSIAQGVSYGWAHATIQHLIDQGIAKKNGNQVTIIDMEKLLNGVAWERPTQGLVKIEQRIPYDDVHNAAKELSRLLDSQGINYAFASYFAGSLYTGQSVRFDSIQMYYDKDKLDEVRELIGPEPDSSKIKLHFMVPDRELFGESRPIDGIKVTSPSQTLLDLAGLGYKGKDLTKAMVATYGQL